LGEGQDCDELHFARLSRLIGASDVGSFAHFFQSLPIKDHQGVFGPPIVGVRGVFVVKTVKCQTLQHAAIAWRARVASATSRIELAVGVKVQNVAEITQSRFRILDARHKDHLAGALNWSERVLCRVVVGVYLYLCATQVEEMTIQDNERGLPDAAWVEIYGAPRDLRLFSRQFGVGPLHYYIPKTVRMDVQRDIVKESVGGESVGLAGVNDVVTDLEASGHIPKVTAEREKQRRLVDFATHVGVPASAAAAREVIRGVADKCVGCQHKCAGQPIKIDGDIFCSTSCYRSWAVQLRCEECDSSASQHDARSDLIQLADGQTFNAGNPMACAACGGLMVYRQWVGSLVPSMPSVCQP